MAEKTFLNQNGVSVTNSRIIIGGQTFAMSNITSVRMIEETPSYKGPLILGAIGILPMLSGDGGGIGVGLLLIALAAIWAFTKKAKYFVGLMTAAGESKALNSEDQNYIGSIVQAVNDAIIERG